jgi:hypothetical protein
MITSTLRRLKRKKLFHRKNPFPQLPGPSHPHLSLPHISETYKKGYCPKAGQDRHRAEWV